MSSLKSCFVVLCLLLVLMANVSLGQECTCNCAELTAVHDKCISDYWALDGEKNQVVQELQTELARSKERYEAGLAEQQQAFEVQRQALEEQVQNAASQGSEAFQAQLEEHRQAFQRELQGATAEANERCQAQLAAEQATHQAQLQEVGGAQEAALVSCQAQNQKLNEELAKNKKETERQVNAVSLRLEEELADTKEELFNRDVALDKAEKIASAAQQELEEVHRAMQEMKASKTIITVDYDLLLERLDEIKTIIMEYVDKFVAFMEKNFEFAKEKFLEFWDYLEVNVFPEIKRIYEKQVVPFCLEVKDEAVELYKQFMAFCEKTYEPYREPVNQKLDEAKKSLNANYKKHLEPKVKEYKLDEYAAQGKEKALQAKDNAIQYGKELDAKLTAWVKQGTKVSLDYVKLQEGPEFVINALEKAHNEYRIVTIYIESFCFFFVLYWIALWFINSRKKRAKKQKQLAKQLKKEQYLKQQQQANKPMTFKDKNKNAKSGKKKTH
jgi:hypothetical protein